MNANYTQKNANEIEKLIISDNKCLYKGLSYTLVGCFFDVYNELGPAHKEKIYHEALKVIFDERKLQYKSKPKIKLAFHDQPVGVYEPDFVIEEKNIVEIKSVIAMPNVFEKQLYYYLRATDYKAGYLVNFGNEKIDIRRRVYDTVRLT